MNNLFHTFKNLAIPVVFGLMVMTSCSKEDDDYLPDTGGIWVKDLDATEGPVSYSFSNNAHVGKTDTENWDIKFDHLNIWINGGSSGSGDISAQLLAQPYDAISEAPLTGYLQDKKNVPAIPKDDGKGGGWYRYTMDDIPKHAVLMNSSRTIIIKTGNDRYFKVQMISYYEGNPDTSDPNIFEQEPVELPGNRPPSPVCTFRYAAIPGPSGLK